MKKGIKHVNPEGTKNMELKLLVFLFTWGGEPSCEQQGLRDKLAMMEPGGRRGGSSIVGHWICLARSLALKGGGSYLAAGH